ncbi:MAG: DinB family protein [Bacteroidota bacterium]
MLLKKPIEEVFIRLSDALDRLSDKEYTQPSDILFNASIGQHIRHIIELFQCLEKGYDEGRVNYEKRKRDYRIETDKNLAAFLLRKIFRNLGKPNKRLSLEAEDYNETVETVMIPSNYYREIAYNLEHTIHHMALIRVGINEVSGIRLPGEFGVAYSTIKYRQQCAQ